MYIHILRAYYGEDGLTRTGPRWEHDHLNKAEASGFRTSHWSQSITAGRNLDDDWQRNVNSTLLSIRRLWCADEGISRLLSVGIAIVQRITICVYGYLNVLIPIYKNIMYTLYTHLSYSKLKFPWTYVFIVCTTLNRLDVIRLNSRHVVRGQRVSLLTTQCHGWGVNLLVIDPLSNVLLAPLTENR